mgnify:FL=1
MNNFPKKLSKIVKARIASTSLQLRLTWEIILILILGFSSLTLWMDWEIKQLPIALSEAGRRSMILDHLKVMGFLAFFITATPIYLSLQRSLIPLRQIAEIYSSRLQPYPITSNQMPREIRIIARNWNRLLAKFSEAREQQRQLTNNLAHELRTPLSMVYGFLQRTQQRSENLIDSQKEALDMAVEEAERMVQLLQDWLNVTRSDESFVSLPRETLLLNDLLTEVADMTEKFEHRKIQVEVPTFPVQIQAQSDRLMQVLSHLLENAIQYSDAREPVTVKLTQAEDWAVIQVIDQGCGIPLSEQSRIFEPFYRVDPSRKITVRSVPNEGSTFILKFPILGAEQ